MKYLDVSFLYLYVKMQFAYPMGHLDLILVATEHQNQLSKKADKATAANPLQAPVSSTGDKAGESVDFRLTGQRERFFEVEPSLVRSRQTQLQKEQMFSISFLSQLLYVCWIPLWEEDLFGATKCEVLTPSDFDLLVLSFKFQSNVFFPLFRPCLAKTSSTVDNRSLQLKSNNHSHWQLEDRSFRGTFTTAEVKIDLESGYRIVFVAEKKMVEEKKARVSIRQLHEWILENYNGNLWLATVDLRLPTRQWSRIWNFL